MLTKRHFLLSSATAVAVSQPLASAQARTAQATRLHDLAGLKEWAALLGERFEIDGSSVSLSEVTATDGSGAQFSVAFTAIEGSQPRAGLHRVEHSQAGSLQLFLSATSTGLRADFARLAG
jgi:hypothetical protein